jgi:hypothetical protein
LPSPTVRGPCTPMSGCSSASRIIESLGGRTAARDHRDDRRGRAPGLDSVWTAEAWEMLPKKSCDRSLSSRSDHATVAEDASAIEIRPQLLLGRGQELIERAGLRLTLHSYSIPVSVRGRRDRSGAGSLICHNRRQDGRQRRVLNGRLGGATRQGDRADRA